MRNATAASEPALSGLREILMVEDSATDADLALRAFKRADFANPVTVAGTAEQGLEYLFGTGGFADRGPTQPHLILLDLKLPGMSGVDFLRRIRADGRTRHIPVVVLSLSESDRDVAACIQMGAEAYLVKPVNFEDFARIAGGLKLRLTLVAKPVPSSPGGWVLSGACEVPHVQPRTGGRTGGIAPIPP